MVDENNPDVREELEAILFGLAHYGRQSQGAPELNLFADLAPAFAPDQLLKVLDNFFRTGAGMRFDRLRTLSVLLSYCPTEGSEAVLGELALQMWPVKPPMPASLVPVAYQGVKSREPNHNYRAEVVVWLAKELPPEQAFRLLVRELESVSQEPSWAYTQYNAIIPLARAIADIPKVSLTHPELEELSSRLLEVAQAIPIQIQRLQIIISILPLLLSGINRKLLEQILREINELPSSGERAKLLVSFIGSLSSLLSNWTTAKEELPANSRESFIGDQLWQELESVKADLLEQGFAAVKSLGDKDQERESLLAQLSLEADEAFSQTILDVAVSQHMKDVWPSPETSLAQTFGSLVSSLPTRLHDKLSIIVQSRQLPLTERQTWGLYPYASRKQLIAAVNSLSKEVLFENDQAEMLVRVVHFLPAEDRITVFDRLLKMENPEMVYSCLLNLLPALPDVHRQQAIQIAQKLGEGWYTWRAWAAILERFPDCEPSSIPEEATRVSARSLCRLWQANPAEIQSEILEHMIRRLWEFYGGLAPPGDGASIETDALEEGSQTSAVLPMTPAEAKADVPADESELTPTADAPADDWEDMGYWPPGEPIAFAEPEKGEGEVDKADEAEMAEVTPEEEISDLEGFQLPESPPPQPSAAFPSLLGRIIKNLSGGKAYDYSESARSGTATVSTGFASQKNPEQAITNRSPLKPNGEYYFLFTIGERRKFDIAPPDQPIHAPLEKLPPKARLQVALFGFPGEIDIRPGQDVGELELMPNRSVRVVKRAAEPAGLSDQRLLDQVLFFPVRTPAVPGCYRLRANLYCQGVLVQSYLVQVLVLPSLRRLVSRLRIWHPRPALETSLDYTLSNDLNASVLADLGLHSLSILINDNGNGTHGMRLFGRSGEELLKGDASFTGQELQNLIEQGRGALRQVAWGEKREWDPAWKMEQKYKYLRHSPEDWRVNLKSDLVVLAKWGWRFYTQVLRHLAESGAQSDEEAQQKREQIKQALASTSIIQIAAKESLRHVLPAAMIYDHPLHDTLPESMISLCPEFTAALESGTPLENTACFQNTCPSRGNIQVVCPSGFWGYRHILGLPVSIGADQGNTGTKINFKDSPVLTVSFSTDLDLRAGHLLKIHELRLPLVWFEADTGQETLEYLRASNSHLVYFYCHGGLTEDKVPYLQVGSTNDPWGLITPSVLPAMQIRWVQPRPLVFINGCHTTALEPEAALDMVSGFVRDAGAAGVIGTEITIFEPLATAFAEEFLRLFLNGVPVGQAVRSARLRLLQGGNPLGLVYIPYAVASLALEGETG